MTTANDNQPTGQDKEIASPNDVNARRRLLLKGLGKGSVAGLATALPLKTLASTSVFTHPNAPGPQIRCGISGMTSGIHSRDTTTSVCQGYSPGWWGQQDNASPGKPRRTWPCNYAEAYDVKFPRPPLPLLNGQKPSLFQVVKDYPNTDTRHWICAYLNGLSRGPDGTFPYSGQEVLSFYNGTGPYTTAAALAFFKTYMETHTG